MPIQLLELGMTLVICYAKGTFMDVGAKIGGYHQDCYTFKINIVL